MKVLKIDKNTSLKYWFDTITQERVKGMGEETIGRSLLSSLITKVANAGASKKIAPVMTSEATKNLAKKGIKNAIDNGSEETGAALGRLVSSEVNNLIKKRKLNREDLRKLIQNHPQNKKNVNKGRIGREFDKLLQ